MNISKPSAPLNPEVLNNLLLDSNRGEVDDLKKQLYDLRQKRSNYTAFGKYVPATGFLVFLIFIAAYIKWESQYLLFVGAFYLIVAIAFPLFTYAGVLDTEIEAIESEIALRLTGAEATEQRAERLFKSHEIDLRRYYQQTLRHSAFVFAAGIGCKLALAEFGAAETYDDDSLLNIRKELIAYGIPDEIASKLVRTVSRIIIDSSQAPGGQQTPTIVPY